MKFLLINLLLLITSVVLSLIIAPIGFTYAVVKIIVVSIVMLFKEKSLRKSFSFFCKETGSYFHNISYSTDQEGNVVMQYLFNDIMIEKDGYKFGNPDETLSSVYGKNHLLIKLKKVGRFINRMLNKMEKDHSIKSIEADE